MTLPPQTVLTIGSATTAFDIPTDCYDHTASPRTTLAVRTPTYILPLSYVCHPRSLGAYDGPLDIATTDQLFLTLPSIIDAQLARDLVASFAAKEPDRYAALAAAGFPVVDSRDGSAVLMHNLIERAGGHYVDVGETALLAEGKAGVEAGTEPVGWTEGALRFGDGSEV
ncbi:hypothetical protein DIS24_g2493 [Lasiodiplodia hormozganensis]|uniref:Uncharacterized protein n=1 Tax=Lasiodiplodia hormozganensis TaxID=869390 RepID=A0AA39Z109_9PEZI|nr:hypothetical protein DIS24_g2493 [Lasiodiplodia hormozganensis]